jgi:hypothetical protein
MSKVTSYSFSVQFGFNPIIELGSLILPSRLQAQGIVNALPHSDCCKYFITAGLIEIDDLNIIKPPFIPVIFNTATDSSRIKRRNRYWNRLNAIQNAINEYFRPVVKT